MKRIRRLEMLVLCWVGWVVGADAEVYGNATDAWEASALARARGAGLVSASIVSLVAFWAMATFAPLDALLLVLAVLMFVGGTFALAGAIRNAILGNAYEQQARDLTVPVRRFDGIEETPVHVCECSLCRWAPERCENCGKPWASPDVKIIPHQGESEA